MNNKLPLIGIFVLSVAIIIAGVSVSYAINNNNSDKLLLSKKSAANYIGISDKQFDALLKKEEQVRSENSYTPDSVILYVEIENEQYFNKIQLKKWMEYNLYNDWY
jgi:hypothetical protein